ncbi:MAG: nucleotidyltransferase, partial [Acidobacteriota bacterium]
MADDDTTQPGLASREPTVEDLRNLCRELNQRGARYVVIGGFAIRAAGYARQTMDVDLLVADDADNEARVFDALATLPDAAVRELEPGELQKYTVIRVADEIVVD